MEENPNYLQKLKFKETVSFSSLQRQVEAGYTWKGSCDRLGGIKASTLAIVGSDDIVTPPANSLMLAQKIPGAWLMQIKGGGHGLIYQYPDKFSRIVLTFLET
jgi:pimeloyl-ACP methyl ester carboxylesterase